MDSGVLESKLFHFHGEFLENIGKNGHIETPLNKFESPV